jgi:hypothetical protein
MRDNRPYGSEGGEGDTFPTPIGDSCDQRDRKTLWTGFCIGSFIWKSHF